MAVDTKPILVHDAALSVRDLTVNLPQGMERAHAVENISFDLKRGQILCIIGESGSGKSVTANAIMGLLPKIIRVSSGAIHLDGTTIIGASPKKLRGPARPGRVHDFSGPAVGAQPSDDGRRTDRRSHGRTLCRHSETSRRSRPWSC